MKNLTNIALTGLTLGLLAGSCSKEESTTEVSPQTAEVKTDTSYKDGSNRYKDSLTQDSLGLYSKQTTYDDSTEASEGRMIGGGNTLVNED